MGNGCMGKTLSKEDLQFLLNTTCFTETQIRQWYDGFMKDCPDGYLRRSQFLSIYEALFTDHRASAFYSHVFRAFDEDGSGCIDFKEFLQAISVTQSGLPKDRLKLAFKLYDVDSSGQVEIHEMAEIIKAVYLMMDPDMEDLVELAEKKAQDVFTKVDADNDGIVTEDEFVSACITDESLYKLLASGDMSDKTDVKQSDGGDK